MSLQQNQLDERLKQAVELVWVQGVPPERFWHRVARYIPGMPARACALRYEHLQVEKKQKEKQKKLTAQKTGTNTRPSSSKPTSSTNPKDSSEQPAKSQLTVSSEPTASLPASGDDAGAASSTTPTGCIAIHVHDESRCLDKDFIVHREVLLANMKYFEDCLAERERRGDSLQNVDISVHCDISVFRWLLIHTYQCGVVSALENIKPTEFPAKTFLTADLEPISVKTVIPVLISAHFLRMAPLVDECLSFLMDPNQLKQVLQLPLDLTCMSDDIIQRMVLGIPPQLYGDPLLVPDPKHKLIPRLFTSSLQLLLKDITLVKCARCGLVHSRHALEYDGSGSKGISTCSRAKKYIDFHGNVVAKHQIDASFDVNKYIIFLRRKLQSWDAVFWFILGTVSYLQCEVCGLMFQLRQLKHCAYHPTKPRFSRGSSEGVYPCCGAAASRFRPPSTPLERGCRFKPHSHDPNGSLISPWTSSRIPNAGGRWKGLSASDTLLKIVDNFGSKILTSPSISVPHRPAYAASGQRAAPSSARERPPTSARGRPSTRPSLAPTAPTASSGSSDTSRSSNSGLDEPDVEGSNSSDTDSYYSSSSLLSFQQSDDPGSDSEPDLTDTPTGDPGGRDLWRVADFLVHGKGPTITVPGSTAGAKAADGDGVRPPQRIRFPYLPIRYRRYNRSKKSLSDRQRFNVLVDIIHEEDRDKTESLEQRLLAARSKSLDPTRKPSGVPNITFKAVPADFMIVGGKKRVRK
eukprot:gnl/Dysnectes_brevis/2515_a3011_608.p1 GENE.gnl/Dysnectes_brevis/2515_a3011_608~~gnl/Dysnectes_brevis/2515_a3011_608.p1  ORF type:complete len:747 (-),score=125.01 gnl/Dysnectes_brevis/2515_a3011_608:34-2274(-)